MPIVTRDKVELYYQDNQPIAPVTHTVLLIHGLGCCTEAWEPQQAALLANHCRVISLDLRGHGRSGKPRGPYSIELFTDDVVYLLRFLKAPPCIVIGHSLGGVIAYDLAIRYPELVQSLVIINSFSEAKLNSFKALRLYFYRIVVINILGIQRWGQLLAKQLFPPPAGRVFHTQFRELYRWNQRRPYLAALRALVGFSLSHRLQEIQCQVLLISADQDYLPVAVKQRDLLNLNQARLAVITASRHFTLWDQPAALNRLIQTFINDGK